jgi:uncharacterized protein
MKSIKEIIDAYFSAKSMAKKYYLLHVENVTKKALEICDKNPHLQADRVLVEYGSMLHDIGICRVFAPEIGCYEEAPYVRHGILGAEIVRQEGWKEIAPFCENHIGVGITVADIKHYRLPLPNRDMIPQTIEQKIVAFADKFFSKSQRPLSTPKSIEKIHASLLRFGSEKITIFNQWCELFGENSPK